MPLFSKFRSKSAQNTKDRKPQQDAAANGVAAAPVKPRWQSTWTSAEIVPEEVEELVHGCTAEMKLRAEALDYPFLLLPFRLDTDSGSARSFIGNFFKSNASGSQQYRGAALRQELRLTDPFVLCSILKWCWSRMPGGVVSWPVYEGFKIGEREARMARNAFETFVPIGVDSSARKNIIEDFFELLAAVAAHGKLNGLGGRKLSRLAGWWAFEHSDGGKGFEGGYKSWTTAADASSHMFFAYLRSLSPEADPALSVIERIPRSLQALLAQTEYPPEAPTLLQRTTPRVVMVVGNVSPTPFALLRRAKHFEYRDNDRVLQELSEFEDPVDALTDECKRVLQVIASTNSSADVRSRHGPVPTNPDESWSAFSNMGFSDLSTLTTTQTTQSATSGMNGHSKPAESGLRSTPRSRNADHGRPTTPSWADFLSSGFADEEQAGPRPAAMLLPPDKQLPQIGSRAQTPMSGYPGSSDGENLAPGELAAIASVDLDDAFWWVWMTSLASEEPNERKAAFGRCALIETKIQNGRWLIMEEQVKGASPDPIEGAQIVEKKSRFGFTKRGKKEKKLSPPPPPPEMERTVSATPSKVSLGADKHAKIKAAASALASKEFGDHGESTQRRGRVEDAASMKTNSVLTLGLRSEAGPAMQWANTYDKSAIRAAYLGDNFAGRGQSKENLTQKTSSVNLQADESATPRLEKASELVPAATNFPQDKRSERDLPSSPAEQRAAPPVVATSPPEEERRQPEPAPLPSKAPDAIVIPVEAKQQQCDAEHVPVPETTRAEPADPISKEVGAAPTSPRSGKVDRKPLPRTNNIQDHPAFRQQSVDSAQSHPPPKTQEPAAIAAQKALEGGKSSPESQRSNKLHKKQTAGAPSGFKKMFGRGKDKMKANRKSVDVQAKQHSTLAPPSEGSFTRRLSLMRKKSAPQQQQAPAVPQAQDSQATLHAAQATGGAENEPAMPSPPGVYNGSVDNVSRVNTRDARAADAEFARFDQGPMDDMPAAAPRDSTDDSTADVESEAPESPTAAHHAAPPQAAQEYPTPNEDYATPLEQNSASAGARQNFSYGGGNDDAVSEVSMDDTPQQPPASNKDRWAQIRENAARRAARASEEQSRVSADRRTEDDGETSGEETIESRVARIKARVAELTGNSGADASAGGTQQSVGASGLRQY